MIKKLTFNAANVTSNDDSVLYKALGAGDRILKGCEITHGIDEIYIVDGYISCYGRQLRVEGTEPVKVPAAVVATPYNLVLEIDMDNDTQAFKAITSDPVQDDISAGSGMYQMLIATFTMGIDGIEEFTEKATRGGLALASNPNMLDNPWFTVNQRGNKTETVTIATYFNDRWFCTEGIVSSAKGKLTYTQTASYGGVHQRIENQGNQFANKDMTLSAEIDGVLISKTFRFPEESETEEPITITSNITCSVYYDSSFYQIKIIFSDNNEHEITKAKLEYGPVSTLALDIAPKYTTELLKCQRYYYDSRYYGNRTLSLRNYNLENVMFPMTMRVLPAVSVMPNTGSLYTDYITLNGFRIQNLINDQVDYGYIATADL